MKRYALEVYIDNTLIFFMEFQSITTVARFVDRFLNTSQFNIWFDLTDLIKDRSISVKELMRIWHS